MNRINQFLVASFMSAAMLFAGSIQAMEIQKYSNLSNEDRAEYFGLLLQGAEQVLNEQGRTADVQKVDRLFSTTLPGDKNILGVIEFERNAGILLEEDAKNALAHPTDPRLEIEDAMVATLHMNDIELPDSFFQLASLKGFQPKFTMQQPKKTKK